jgi:octaheme c-type cytochrome (tetrathionate reductase family)
MHKKEGDVAPGNRNVIPLIAAIGCLMFTVLAVLPLSNVAAQEAGEQNGQTGQTGEHDMQPCPLCHTEPGELRLAQGETGNGEDEGEEGESGEEGEEGESVTPSTADHSQYEILQQDFATGPDVTEACLSCHNQADEQLHATIHWHWEFEHPETGQLLGKRNIIDNNVLSIAENQEYCATCHTGYGFEGANFDFSAAQNIDCLVCHDTTGEYDKLPGAAGHPAYEPTEYPPGSGNTWPPVDLTQVAQNVGPTSRTSCGSCHFGERNVDPFIHGHLPAALEDPSEELDVHMGTDFLDFSCSSCHEPQNHDFFSSKYWPASSNDVGPEHLIHATCVSCHDQDDVHDSATLTQHTDRIACQTCHIPQYGRAGPEMISWDWSQAGRTNADGSPVVERSAEGLLLYHGHYGTFEWAENITPEYTWFDGTITYTKVGDTITQTQALDGGPQAVQVNRYHGSYDNPETKLWPLRVYRGVQPYDPQNNTLVAANLYGDEQSAYWTGLNWTSAISTAMQAEGVPFSGEHAFIETEMAWLMNHMVAPADQAVRCGQCHSRDGILSNVSGAYVPGRDYNLAIDLLGWLLVGGTLAGVLVHGGLRFMTHQLHVNPFGEAGTSDDEKEA